MTTARLILQAKLNPRGPVSVLSATPFLGGMLHGVLEHVVGRGAVDAELAGLLGLGRANALKRYAILPPPFDDSRHEQAPAPSLRAAIVLYGEAGRHTERLAGLLQRHWRELRCNGLSDRVTALAIHTEAPPARAWPAPNFVPALERLSLRWHTPLLLDNPAQRAATSAPVAPTLLRVVRSLGKRIQSLEPALAARLGLGGRDWIVAEEAIRHLPVAAHSLSPVRWQYGSRSHDKTFRCTGLLGDIHYPGPIPPPIHALLHCGRWFGVGQRTSMGQGMYEVISTKAIQTTQQGYG